MTDESITDADLEQIQQRVDAASKGPWQSFVEGRDNESGDSFIRIGGFADDEDDMYVSRDGSGVTAADLDFIAAARQDIPRLLAEVRRLRREGDHAERRL